MKSAEKILNRMIDELELAIIKAKAQLEYVEESTYKTDEQIEEEIFGQKLI